ncbi:S-layer homology domain-containing protein [Iningainema tapete]|uniref:S-layer homology domain-containing protein n=1 Tax=Iningainema tapete BLCC-T55 TaxID=2748662 RepID=A0A8J6XCZ1_9CYAN|nr:S-layer homology domain-containing protein [Iningainema tapete BLCC-T55]
MVRCKRPTIFLSLAVLLTSLTACANTPVAKNLEQSLAADSRLKDNPVSFGANQVSNSQPTPTTQPTVQLPADFPKEIPVYPNANLLEVTPSSNSARWTSSDPSNIIASYYQQQFQANNWQILSNSNDQNGLLEAKRNDVQVKVSIQPKSVTNAAPNQPQTATELLIEYRRGEATAQSTPTPEASPNETISPGSPQFIGPSAPATPLSVAANQNTTTPAQEIADLKGTPSELQQYVKDLVALGVIPVQANTAKSNSATTNQFEPGKTITRREYARWLVAANNAMHANNPAKQIRLASQSAQPAFRDVPKTHPDFPAIQGLAEAGLIPSSLSGDSTAVLFRPDAPLTREQLILWKIPLDIRSSLPTANIDTVRQTWGFQDAAKIDPLALRAVLADFQNAEKSNIRRVFGYTTLFQPKKPVSRAEAAAALWYFGTQSEGVSAVDALKLKS